MKGKIFERLESVAIFEGMPRVKIHQAQLIRHFCRRFFPLEIFRDVHKQELVCNLILEVTGRKWAGEERTQWVPVAPDEEDGVAGIAAMVMRENNRRYVATICPWIHPEKVDVLAEMVTPGTWTYYYTLTVCIPRERFDDLQQVVEQVKSAPLAPHFGIRIGPDGDMLLVFVLDQASNDFAAKVETEKALATHYGVRTDNIKEFPIQLPIPGTAVFYQDGKKKAVVEMWESYKTVLYSLADIQAAYSVHEGDKDDPATPELAEAGEGERGKQDDETSNSEGDGLPPKRKPIT